MTVGLLIRRLSTVSNYANFLHASWNSIAFDIVLSPLPVYCAQRKFCKACSSKIQPVNSGIFLCNYYKIAQTSCSRTYCSSIKSLDISPTEAVKKIYDKIHDSIELRRSMPPNDWTWSLINNCKNHEDIKLLFSALQKIRVFRLSNLRIHANFNCHLCSEVAKACTSVGAIQYGRMTLWKHNIYGFVPVLESAHHLLAYADAKADIATMLDTLKLLRMNFVKLKPRTADFVFRICHKAGEWELISRYAKKFLKEGVVLRSTTFDIWMDFAAQRGDADSIWKIEKLRSESTKYLSLQSRFSCAKGFILEHKPEEAAAIIQVFNQVLPEEKKPHLMKELDNLVNVWPSDVVKHCEAERIQEFEETLKSDISAMIAALASMGFQPDTSV